MSSDRLAALILLVLFAIYASRIGDIQLDIWAADSYLTARTLPTVLAVAGLVLAAVLFCWPESAHRPASLTRAQRVRLASLIAALALFAATLEWLGLWLACGAFLVLTQLIEGERRPLPMLGLAIGLPGMLWLLVEKGLQQQVAAGTLL